MVIIIMGAMKPHVDDNAYLHPIMDIFINNLRSHPAVMILGDVSGGSIHDKNDFMSILRSTHPAFFLFNIRLVINK